MAKDKKKHDAGDPGESGHDAVATALTTPDAPATSVVPAAGPAERLTARTPAPPAAPPRSVADTAIATVGEVARVVQQVVPGRVPAYLGGAALLVLGVVDLPAVAGGALAYEALRRWRPAR